MSNRMGPSSGHHHNQSSGSACRLLPGIAVCCHLPHLLVACCFIGHHLPSAHHVLDRPIPEMKSTILLYLEYLKSLFNVYINHLCHVCMQCLLHLK